MEEEPFRVPLERLDERDIEKLNYCIDLLYELFLEKTKEMNNITG